MYAGDNFICLNVTTKGLNGKAEPIESLFEKNNNLYNNEWKVVDLEIGSDMMRSILAVTF